MTWLVRISSWFISIFIHLAVIFFSNIFIDHQPNYQKESIRFGVMLSERKKSHSPDMPTKLKSEQTPKKILNTHPLKAQAKKRPTALDYKTDVKEQAHNEKTPSSGLKGVDGQVKMTLPILLNGNDVPLFYPEKAQAMRVQGSVFLKLLVSKQGRVEKAEVKSGPAFGLKEAATNIARKLVFKPGTDHKGKPMAHEIMHEVIFKLSR